MTRIPLAQKSAVAQIIAARLIVCVARVHAGHTTTALDAPTAKQVMEEARCPVRIVHRLDVGPASRPDLFEEGTVVPLADVLPTSCENPGPHLAVNTSGARTVEECVDAVQFAEQWADATFPGPTKVLHKIEIFDLQLRCDNDATLAAIDRLEPHLRQRALPIIEPDPDTAEALALAGVAALRVRAGGIRQLTGIVDPELCRKVIDRVGSQTPIILEGGLASSQDVRTAAALGADAVLFNSAIAESSDPVAFVKDLRDAADASWT